MILPIRMKGYRRAAISAVAAQLRRPGDAYQDSNLPFGLHGEVNARLSYGAQATIVPTPQGLSPLPYLRGAIGADVNLGSVILCEGVFDPKNGAQQIAKPFQRGVQGFEGSFFGLSIGVERVVSSSGTVDTFSITFLNVGVEINSEGENFLGFMPKLKRALGIGAEASGKLGWKF